MGLFEDWLRYYVVWRCLHIFMPFFRLCPIGDASEHNNLSFWLLYSGVFIFALPPRLKCNILCGSRRCWILRVYYNNQHRYYLTGVSYYVEFNARLRVFFYRLCDAPIHWCETLCRLLWLLYGMCVSWRKHEQYNTSILVFLARERVLLLSGPGCRSRLYTLSLYI